MRQLRKIKGWTQEELAEKADMDYKYLGAIERGEKNLTLTNIERIAKGLGIEIYQLFLFSLKGVQTEEKTTEIKIKDLLNMCGDREKTFLLRIMQGFMELK
ncbi:MAG: helix-turn-helix transcriptional regulator [Candidatus Omnitrophica bacterium]|nr:helix-turn-helix transcriptional regulator [Candidatus Omnitrophota bacterium]MBU1810721.1 helix-turn-helix transcriptional regulator [Candidatus Omnitrophota bacterium]